MFNLFTVITARHDCGRLCGGRIGTGFFSFFFFSSRRNAKAFWQLWGAKEACLSLQALFCKENTGTRRMTMFLYIFILHLTLPHLSPPSKEKRRRAGCQNPPFHSAEMFVASVSSSRKSINDFHLLHFLLLISTLKQFAKEPVLKAPYKFWDMCSFICQTSETRCLDIAGWGFFFFLLFLNSHYRI